MMWFTIKKSSLLVVRGPFCLGLTGATGEGMSFEIPSRIQPPFPTRVTTRRFDWIVLEDVEGQAGHQTGPGWIPTTIPRHSMGLVYIPISWGGLGGQCRHIWQSHGVSGIDLMV